MGRVEGKIAIVTGAASGIGRATALLLAREGATVILADLNEEAGEAATAEVRQPGCHAEFYPLDVSSEEDWRGLVEHVESRHGRLDILFNNAGVQRTKTIEEATLEDLRWHMRVNVEGVFLGTKSAIEIMKKNGPDGGSIINAASIYGVVGEELNAPYCTSKGSVRAFSKSAALHCGKSGYGIRVNSIHPGCIVTSMAENEALDVISRTGEKDTEALFEEWRNEHPIGRLGRPEDVAYGVLYLASDESSFVTGSDLVIDGGYTAQ